MVQPRDSSLAYLDAAFWVGARPMTVRISVVICTRDRARILGGALESLATQTLAPRDYEVLVVDNGSRDDTRRVVESAGSRGLAPRYLEEPRGGLSRARNRGWREAKGLRVAYLDDDARAHRTWLERILEAFDGAGPAPTGVGGPVRAVWRGGRPPWVSDAVEEAFSIVDLGPVRRPVGGDRWLLGCNMAFAREALVAAGGFEERLGRDANNLLSMEEVALQRAVLRSGGSLLYDPNVVVDHHIPAERASPRWVERRVFDNGRSAARMRLLEGRRGPGLRARMAWEVLGRIVGDPRAFVALAGRSPDPMAFERRCTTLGRLGYLRESLRFHAS